MIDRLVLQALKDRETFRHLNTAVPREMMDPITVQLLDWYATYFGAYPDHDKVNVEGLTTLIKLRSGLDEETMQGIAGLLEYLEQDLPADMLKHTATQLEERAFAGKVGALLARYHNNEEIDLTYELGRLAEDTRNRIITQADAQWADGDILQYLEQQDDDSGVHFDFLPSLDKTLKGLNIGNNVAVVAPTNAGKTAMLCKIAASFQAQGKILYPGRPALYLVNESLAQVIRPRIYQAAFEKDFNTVLAEAKTGALQEAYAEMMGGADMIRPINIHGMTTTEVFRIIERHNPWLVLGDMTGRIKPPKASGNESKDLEEVWNAFREEAARMGFLHVGSIQISADGFDDLYPPLDAMQWSRVGIQTTLDLALTIGKLKDPMSECIRGISTPKSKLARQGCSDQNFLQYFFDKDLHSWKEVPKVNAVQPRIAKK